MFAANARNNDPKVGTIDDYSVNVVPEPSSMILFGNGAIGLWAIWRKSRDVEEGRRRLDGVTAVRLTGPSSASEDFPKDSQVFPSN